MDQASLIPASADIAVFAALFVIGAAGFLLEKTHFGRTLTGAVWAILIAILLSNIRVIPRDAAAYDFVFTYLVPVLVPLFLFDADLRRIFRETGRTAIAFALAAAGTCAGTIVGVLLLNLGPEEASLGGIFTATYIGGSVNYVALIEGTGFLESADGESVIAAATAVDNLMSALFLAGLALMPGWAWLARKFPHKDFSGGQPAPEAGEETAITANPDKASITAASLSYAVAAALTIVAVSNLLAGWLAAPIAFLSQDALFYLVLTAITVGLATAFPKLMQRLAGSFEIGLVLAFVFFAAIAAGANIPALLTNAPILLAFVVIILAVHAIVVFGGGMLLRLSLPELITASNAAVLGATTAPALAAVKGWRDLVTPGVLVGVLGYAVGTFLGFAIAGLLGAFG